MGCGSSSTSVQTFRNPEENKNYRSQKAPSRHSSATPSIRSQRSEGKEKTKRKSSASSSASVSSSRRPRKTDDESRVSSANSKKNSYVINNSTPVVPVPSNNENDSEDINEIDEKKLEAQKHHEEIQKQTFITGDPEHETRNEKIEENFNQPNTESHEEIAKRKEEKRSQFDHEKVEEESINSHGPVPLSFPPDMDDDTDKNAEYTVDDIVEHNNEVADLDWFKYGKKIYSWKKMKPIIQERVDQFKDIGPLNYYSPTPGSQFGYPIYVTRDHGLTRKELAKVLTYCRVGNSIDVPREQCLARMKQSAEFVLEEDTGTDYFKDYKDQLNRWLADYPMNKVYNDPPDTQSDPNELAFPLPADIQSDPSVLRKWTETWIEFDCEVPEEGAWPMKELLKDDWGDTHDLYANVVQEHHGNEAIEPLDMTIDGDVAWVEIELDLFKNDKTTEHQETVWKKRATRTNLNDPLWMKKRREELAEILKKRYEERQKQYPVENFINFADILEKHWEEFQTLCQKEFIPPVRKTRNSAEVKLETDEHPYIDGQATKRADSADNRLVISHDIEDERHSDGSQHDQDNDVRLESRGSSHRNVERVHSSNSSNKMESEHGDNAEDKLVINHENRQHNDVEINDDNADNDADQMPTLEATDSGLDLNSNDQLDSGRADNDNRKTDGDSIQLTSRPESDGSEKGGKQEKDDFFD
ncbi:uncharacterized protein LOC123526017 [Mercenaria mercenaria]|uniref:uncharacterized protein LOC123526017 n=1 Tax=Mercenaria mercenaria TaxID=6596 RepID=UPI00234EADE3|nr:uncharacterized protein LOC123526017 [Mercenaria mercenaria]XP_045161063.2 uncharacterized protein LOC123526017 [Mercenaria mercenaria]XP_045161064.2 uncharacterized protein LOC123526017 [Mercenaria mercenaria]